MEAPKVEAKEAPKAAAKDEGKGGAKVAAAEPAPAPLGREPAPVVVLDEGPLILVETRKDLSQVKLPFEA